jgi:hypothetical protein
MTFSDKIDKILETNQLGIKNVYKLEKHVDAGRGAINRYYKNNEEPGAATVNRIIEGMKINRVWWETGVGEIYAQQTSDLEAILNHPFVITLKNQITHMEHVIELQKQEIERLKSQ